MPDRVGYDGKYWATGDRLYWDVGLKRRGGVIELWILGGEGVDLDAGQAAALGEELLRLAKEKE